MDIKMTMKTGYYLWSACNMQLARYIRGRECFHTGTHL
jgi:hypothetical protein